MTEVLDPGGISAAVETLRERIAELAAESTAPVVLLIDGPAGSGKTTLAEALADQLEEPVLVHMDSLYRGWQGLEAGARLAAESVVPQLAAGREARWAAWDWRAGSEGEVAVAGPADVVIVEGVGSASSRSRELASLVVWVEAPAEQRYRRAIDRDGDAFEPHWAEWAEQEAVHFAAEGTREAAQTLIDTGDPLE